MYRYCLPDNYINIIGNHIKNSHLTFDITLSHFLSVLNSQIPYEMFGGCATTRPGLSAPFFSLLIHSMTLSLLLNFSKPQISPSEQNE